MDISNYITALDICISYHKEAIEKLEKMKTEALSITVEPSPNTARLDREMIRNMRANWPG